jgi:hypothetical protein
MDSRLFSNDPDVLRELQRMEMRRRRFGGAAIAAVAMLIVAAAVFSGRPPATVGDSGLPGRSFVGPPSSTDAP